MEEPGILVLEAPMGCGKTEAALMSAEILADKFGLGGICYLLPTMATSNAMFSRVRSWLESIASTSDDGETMGLHLLHSKAELNEDYSRLRTWNTSWMGDDASDAERVVAHQWFGGSKRGLLAPFVVGTVDQLLMAALNTRHVHLRHLGLSDKVVIIDEVHAYDAYMSVYLNRTLAFLGAYGVPVIVLSATLPPSRRVRLIRAYQGKDSTSRRRVKPLPEPARREDGSPAYPLLSAAGLDPSASPQYCVCEQDMRGVEVGFELVADDEEFLVSLLQRSLSQGGCVCVLRNTVARAQSTYRVLRERLGVEVVLTHSRFIAIDRAKSDACLARLLGRDAEVRPKGLVVVATQVMEQSLDVDFDLMVTDIAPIDLLLQRMGRLHRHARGHGECERPEPLRTARCLIVGGVGGEGGLPEFDTGTAAVYEPALLLRTAYALQSIDSGRLVLPDDIAGMVERVYEEMDLLPETWRDAAAEADRTLREHTADRETRAKAWLLTKPLRSRANLDGWMRQYVSMGTETEARAAVRDTPDSLEAIVVRRTDVGYEVLPWVAKDLGVDSFMGDGTQECGDASARAAALCSVSLPQQLCAHYCIASVIAYLEQAGNYAGWQGSRWLRGTLVLPIDERGEARIELDGRTFALRYSREEGLELL